MKYLITGGMGVNGAVTARLMVRDGLRPLLMDNRVDYTLIEDIKNQVDIVTGDICDQAALEKAVDDYKVTHIAHLAALMPEGAEANPRLGVRVSLDGTINVLEVARAKGIKRVVYTSSKAVYGEINGAEGPPNYKPLREDYRKIPADLYGSMKVGCEELGRYYRETYGIEFIALRFVSIYGPGKEARHGPLSFYGQLIEKAREGAKWVIPAGRRSVERRGLRRRCRPFGLSCAQSAGAQGVDVQYRHRQSVDAERFFERRGQAVSRSQDRARPWAEQARQKQAELLHLRYLGGAAQYRLRTGVHRRAGREGLRRDIGSVGKIRRRGLTTKARRTRRFRRNIIPKPSCSSCPSW